MLKRGIIIFALIVLFASYASSVKNILTNGDFEYGLGCYGGIWNWPESSGHKVYLSEDAVSGNYSISIQCSSNCQRSGFWTPVIKGNNIEYRLSFYAKGNGPVLNVQAEYSGGTYGDPVYETPNNEWTYYDRTFTAGSDFRVYFYSRNSAGTIWIDNVTLVRTDGSTPELPVPQKINNALDSQFDSNGYLNINSKKTFPIVVFKEDKSDLSTVKDIGFNTLITPPFECINNRQDPFDYWNDAENNGLYVFPDLTMLARVRFPDVFKNYMQDYSGHGAISSWYLVDEPDHSSLDFIVIQPDMLTAMYDAVKTESSLPVGIDHQVDWTFAQIPRYVNSHDFFMFEPYPHYGNIGVYERDTGFAQSADAAQPIWYIHIGYDSLTWQLATMYMSIIQDAKAIIFWRYENIASDSAKLGNVRQAVAELNSISDVLVSSTVTNPVTDNNNIALITKMYNNSFYIIAVNKADSEQSTMFTVDADKVDVLFENRSVSTTSDSFTDYFHPFERHVYHIYNISDDDICKTSVFCSGFEEGNKDIWDDDDGNPDSTNLIMQDPGPVDTEDNHVMRLRVPAGRGGADLVKELPGNYDKLYARWYEKWEPGYDFSAPNHGGGLFAGNRNYLGRSDYRPSGDDFFFTGFEPTVGHGDLERRPYLYSYYRGMYQDCADPNGQCWGDHFPCMVDEGYYCEKPEHRETIIPQKLEAGKWFCIEMMVDMGSAVHNDADADGIEDFWVDGVEYGPFEHLWLRTTDNLKLNILWLELFHHGNHSVEGVMLDNVVVSEHPIGCLGSLQQPSGVQCTEADLDSNGEISNSELNKYINRWLDGELNTGNLLNAVGKWKTGCQ